MFERGINRISKVIEKFDNVKQELLHGIEEINIEEQGNNEMISSLETRNITLNKSRTQAQNVADKITEILGYPKPRSR